MIQGWSYLINVKNAFHLVWTNSRQWTLINAFLVLLLGGLPIIALFVTKLIIDTITESLNASSPTVLMQEIVVLILVATGIGILLVFSRSLSELSREIQSIEVTDAVYEILHAQSIAVDLEYYDNPAYQDTLHRAQRDAPFRPTRVVNSLTSIGQNCVGLLGVAGLIIFYNIWLGLILVIVALPSAFVRLRYSRDLFRLYDERAESERRAFYYHRMMTDPAYAKELRIFNTGPFFSKQFKSIRSDLRKKQSELYKKRFFNDVLAQGLATVALFFTFGFIVLQTIQGILTIGDTVMYFMAFQMGLIFLQGALFAIAGLYEDSLFIGNLNAFLSIGSKIHCPEHPKPVPEKFHSGVKFHNVSYTYPKKRIPAVRGINLTIGPGEVVALVGENGSGKTTLIKLLCLLYTPTTGCISADDIDITEFDPVQWRSRISVIFQDYVKYQMSALENISISTTEDAPDISAIEEAARFSGADVVINRLPQGYNTVLGTMFQNGHELSHGEWQRIALARAFLRDANLIVLDEPSSSLDSVAEAKLFREFRKFIPGKTAIIISHRYSNVKIADRIYVMENGEIVEEGTHSALLKLNGKYARLFHEQTKSLVGK